MEPMLQSFPPSKKTRFGSKLLLSLFTLSLSACGAGTEGTEAEPQPETPQAETWPEAPQGEAQLGTGEGGSEALLATARVRLMAANISSGNYQSYDPGNGTRIFQGTKPDVVMIQEFNYGDNSATAIRNFVNTAFGSTFSYYREAGAQIPNGVISRWPIVASGEWDDPYVTNRDFAYARIDIPGPKDLWVVSVHLLTSDATTRNNEATNLVSRIKSLVPAGDYLAIGGDFNTSARTESCFSTFSQVVATGSPYPADKNGNTNTNATRAKPYDHVLVDSDLRAYQTATVIGSSSFSAGLVVDTRVYSPLSDISPALSGDSGATNMQHMAVIKDFLVPTL
jgi:endonuclease/exonuclease/phosphatase family metal-dependent hydrolase